MKQHLLTTTEAAQYLGISKAFLERDRWAGARFPYHAARIPFVRVGTRAVRYERRVLDTYIEQQRRTSTADLEQGGGHYDSHP